MDIKHDNIFFSKTVILFCMLFDCNEKGKENRNDALATALKGPNIIVLMADNQGWGDTGYNEHPYLKTPNLDAMAANGVVFERFYAASAVGSPTIPEVVLRRMVDY